MGVRTFHREVLKMRRRWVHRISNQGIPDSPFDTCAICRCPFKQACIECQANSKPSELVELSKGIVIEAKRLWKTLLLASKRPPFAALGIDIMQLIYKLALPEQTVRTKCPIIQIHCNHIYHRCCIEKWVKKRPTCPLDNQSTTELILENFSCQLTLTNGKVDVIEVYQSEWKG